MTEAPRRLVTLVESSPRDQLQPKLQTYDYFKPGDALPQVRPVLINIADKTARVIPNDLFTNAFTPDGALNVRWSPRGEAPVDGFVTRGNLRRFRRRTERDARVAGLQ